MENEIIMSLSILLDIVSGKSSFKITFKIFNFSLIWGKKLGSHTRLTGRKTPLDTSVQSGNNDADLCLQIHKFELYLRQKLNINSNYFIPFTSASKTRATVQQTLW